MEIDPVCSMQIDPERAAARAEHQGKTYHFCCPGCQKAFLADPPKFIGKAHSSGAHPAGHHHAKH
ncbi:MAG: YHS domain-containing protein [Betaproteobacteria bacterium]|nr:YHS domain-containing protein [Betaproteobacteria bacterium]